ncbi:MAG TPA: YciI family protein [Polyangiaceae bacterium]|nr:YciI family protein [Polyangiaceae bacterium]
MRFMVMHKVDAKMEAGGPPDAHIIQSMGALVQESLKNRVFITGAGLHRSEKRVRVKSSAGRCLVSPGPYGGENELLASYAMIKVKSLADAVEHAQRCALAEGDCEIEVGPVVEAWDLGIVPKPTGDIPLQALLLTKADAAFERGARSKEQQAAALQTLSESLADNGALLATGTLAPSSKGVRAKPGAGKRTWIDGPFTESKELIAGFSILDVPSLRDAIAWADRYATILTESEVDVRELVDG